MTPTPLDRKLLRDLRHGWGQALATALIIAAGVATLITFMGSYRSLSETRNAYYERERFADVFTSLKRGPRDLVAEAARLPDVAIAEGRIVTMALLDIPGMREPASARLVSLPPRGEPRLNRLYLRAGRLPEPGRWDEVVLSESFAKAHEFRAGSTLSATFGGAKRTLRIVGIVLSPEYINTLGPGDIVPDDRRFGVAWMRQGALEAALDLDGAINDLNLTLMRNGSVPATIAALDRLLEPYGGLGAYDRTDQLSHAFLDADLQQLQGLTAIIPPIFLAVAAFLTNMTLSRQIALERAEIGLMKALGYGRGAVLGHYLKSVLVVAALGVLHGFAMGDWFARSMASLYQQFYHFPLLVSVRAPNAFLIAGFAAFGAAALGALRASWSAASLPPAEAMRPPAPPRYRQGWVSAALARLLPLEIMMVLRHLRRFPGRAATTTLGLALSVAALISATFSLDSIDHTLDVTFGVMERQHATVLFSEAKAAGAVREVGRWPGVLVSRPMQAVPVTLRHGHLEHSGALTGVTGDAGLSRVVDTELRPIALPETGIVLSQTLARKLEVGPGDRIDVEVKTGLRQTHALRVFGEVEQYLGSGAYMRADALDRLLRQAPAANGAHVLVDAARWPEFYAEAKNAPGVAALSLVTRSRQRFEATMAENLRISVAIYVVFASLIAIGVAYNSARISLSERSRELASLRVLGFNRREVSTIILGELFVCVLLALPIGWLIGRGLADLIARSISQELYSIPVVIYPATYAWASIMALTAVGASGLLMVRRIARLDLIAVLKTRD